VTDVNKGKDIWQKLVGHEEAAVTVLFKSNHDKMEMNGIVWH